MTSWEGRGEGAVVGGWLVKHRRSESGIGRELGFM